MVVVAVIEVVVVVVVVAVVAVIAVKKQWIFRFVSSKCIKHVRGTTLSLASRLAMTQGQPRLIVRREKDCLYFQNVFLFHKVFLF